MKDRKIVGFRGCMTHGGINLDYAFFHCDNEKCPSCNMWRDTVKSVVQEELDKATSELSEQEIEEIKKQYPEAFEITQEKLDKLIKDFYNQKK